MNYALDAGAMIAFLENEPGVEVVVEALTEPGSHCYAHLINLAEIYYLYFREGGVSLAEEALQTLEEAGVVLREDHDSPFWKEAALYKGQHAMALPDAFCLALARRVGGVLLTTDRKELGPLAPLGYAPIRFLR